MTKFIVHIGDGKCGSSSVQKSLFDAREALAALGIVYETTTPLQGHFNLATLAGKTLRTADGDAKQSAEESIALIKRAAGANSTVLLSAENFFNLRPESLNEILHLISREIEQIDIIAYLRAPDSMYLSLVQQTLKGDSRFPLPSQYARRVDRILQRWHESTLIHSLTVHNFDRRVLVNGDVVDDFSAILRDLTGHDHIALPHASENATLSAEQMIVLQRYRGQRLKEHDGKLHSDSQRVIAFFDRLNTLGFPGSKPVLKQVARQIVLHKNHQIVDAVHEMFPHVTLLSASHAPPFRPQHKWYPKGSVAQILRDVDRTLVAVLRPIVFGINRDARRREITALVCRLRLLIEDYNLDGHAVFSQITAFWRAMGYQVRADLFAALAAEPYFKNDGWRFMASGSITSSDKVDLPAVTPPYFAKHWAALLAHRAKAADDLGYTYLHSIIPAKERIYPEKLPASHALGAQRPADQVVQLAQPLVRCVDHLSVLEQMKAVGADSFSPEGLLWNKAAARSAFDATMDALGLVQQAGEDIPFSLVMASETRGLGHIRVYEHANKSSPRCVVFHDAWSEIQFEMFARNFSRVVFCWQPAVDVAIVRCEAPDYVITQQSEHRLVDCPDDVQGPSHEEYLRRRSNVATTT